MNQMLKNGQNLKLETGGSCSVRRLLGAGGQGEVYEVELDGQSYALKWYLPNQATGEQLTLLQGLVRRGAPTDRFLWPLDLVTSTDNKSFGYIMHLREPRFNGIADMMKRRSEPTFNALCTAGYELADSYLQLHAKGLCYRDISFGNVFLDPETGQVRICDNDNVAVTGMAASGVLGTQRFMAPEIVRGEAHPSTETDRFSLAVLLFFMFMMHHPLEGKLEDEIRCFDLPAMNKLYGYAPVFIWDPANDSNRPVPGYHDNAIVYWDMYPSYVRNLFTKSFTDGITDPKNGRVVESEWRKTFIQLRDSIMLCGNCGNENFYDSTKISSGKDIICWSCKQPVKLPPRIKIDNHVVMLNNNTKLYSHHVGEFYDFSSIIAEVVRHPQNPNIWGLKNLSQEKWVVVNEDGSLSDIPPGKSLTIAYGKRINFGKVEGVVRL